MWRENKKMNKKLKCAYCGLYITNHITISFIACLVKLSEEVKGFREKEKNNT